MAYKARSLGGTRERLDVAGLLYACVCACVCACVSVTLLVRVCVCVRVYSQRHASTHDILRGITLK
jgi:hypothetical protein